MSERVLHCWEDGPLTEDGGPTTCLLTDRHAGPHKWTRADAVRITFHKEPEEQRVRERER